VVHISFSSTLRLPGAGGRQLPLHERCTLVDLLRGRSEEHPERAAYTFLANGSVEAATFSFGELDRLARTIAVELLRTARPGDRAVLLYPPGLDFIAGLFGCFYAGVVAVPAYPPRPSRANSRLRSIVEECRPGAVLTTAALLARAEPLRREIPRLAEARWVATEELPTESAEAWRAPDLHADSLAFLQYTSGSTSDPKGVRVSHGNFLANERMIRDLCGHSEETVFVGWLPLYHDMGLMGNVIQPLYIGGRSILMAPSAFLASPVRWLEAVSRYRATTSGGPSFAYDLCLRKIGPEQRAGLDLSSWTVAFNGAEPIRAETLERFSTAFAECGFSRSVFFPCYGLAEATLLVTGSGRGNGSSTAEIDAGALARQRAVRCAPGAPGGRTLVSSGRPAEGLTLVMADPESRTLCPPGQVGEIWVAGPSIAQGYWNRPEQSAEVFGARLADGGREGPFLRTGDLGFVDGGELYVTGRLKDLIILRGRNHYPQDIELTAELAHPALQPGSTAAFAVQVQGEERLAVVVERRPRSQEGIAGVAPAVRRAVAEEHEVQVHVVALVPPGTVLKTSSGKVRRGACRDLLLNGRLESVGVSWAGEDEMAAWTGEALRGEDLPALDEPGRRAALAAWLRQEAGHALRAAPEQLPAQQPLTALGLDSLGAVELEQRILDRLGIELPASTLLEGASLEDVAERLLAGLAAGAVAPVPLAAERSEAPLSAMQKALWFEQQLAPESPAYNIPFAVRLSAGVDVPALRRALAVLVDRHAALRTALTAREGRPMQRFDAGPGLAFVEREVSGEAGLRAAVAAEARRPFDLDRGPLFRAALFTGPGGDRLLVLVAHHIVFDGWSLWVLLDELRLLLEAGTAGRETSLPALPAAYADFVLWQEAMLAGPRGERLWQFWRGELPDGMPPFQLPADRPAAMPGWRGATHRFLVAPELAGQLKSLARKEGTTFHAVLLAAYQALLARSTGQPEVVVGSAVTGRSRPEFRGLVGCLFNIVPLKADLAEDPAFRGLLRQVRGRLAAALAHQDYPSHLLAERLRSGREAGGAPFFQTHFLYQKPHRGEAAPRLLPDGGIRLDLGGLVLDALFLEQEAARAGLELEVFEAGEEIAAWFRYSSALFDAATVERLARRFTAFLSAAARSADQPVSGLPLLDAAERSLLLETWSSNGLASPETAPVHALFQEQAAQTPDRVAAICGDEAVLYRELDERSGRLACRLRRLDDRRGLAGLMAAPDHPLLVGMLGILKAGKGFVPLDPDLPAGRLERMAADCGLAVLAADRRHLARAEEVARLCPAVEHVICLDGEEAAREPPAAVEGAGEGIAYVIFTSGSTGVPKGVPVTHQNLVPLLLWSREVFGFGEHTRVLQSLSYAFDFGVFEILTTLLFGGTLVLRGGAERGDIEGFLEQVRRHRINTLHTTPSFFRAVAISAAAAGERLDQLEVLHLGGEVLSEGLAAEAFVLGGAQCRLFNGYGPTEASVNCALYELGLAAEWRPRGTASVPIGRPSAANRLHALDRWMQPMPVGGPGELFVGGPGLSRGYLGRPDLTAARFVPSPFGKPGGRLYRTGDLVRFHGDGALEFLGRADNQVKIRGYRIELEEIEAALAAHPEVGACAVVAWSPPVGEARLVAYVAARRPEARLDTAELRRLLGRTLPGYMVPTAFSILPELPLSTSGKVDRRALPPPSEAPPAVSYVAPRTPLEEALAGIWGRSLGVEKVGIHDDFFELGGHSLLGTRIIAQIRKELGVEVALRTLFESATIAGFAAAVEGASRVDLPPIVPVPRDVELPVSFAQERIWFLTQLNPELRSYYVPRALRVRGRFQPVLVEETFSEINRRHEILRTTFPAIEGRPVQVIHPPFRMSMPVVDLSALPASVREEGMWRQTLVEGRRSFDLVQGPLLRLTLLRLAPEEHVLVITEHHLVHDGWTQGVLLRDFLVLYDAFSRGEPSPLPELPVQYADFAVWQRRWLRDEVVEHQLAWWKERLAGAPAVLDLPTDRQRPAVQSFHGDQVRWVLPAGLSRALRAASRQMGATLFMTMLSAWDTLLMRLSGQEDLCVGTGVANRRVVEAEGILGMVINTLVLRADLSGSPAFAELVARMREVCVGAYGHQDLPFEKLVSGLRLERSLSHTPLFQVFFAFLDTPMPELELPGLSISVLDAHNRSAKFDVNLTVLLPNEQRVGLEGTREDEITLLFEHSTDLFDRTTVLRMLACFHVLLTGAVADPGLRLAELPLLTAAERSQLLEWGLGGQVERGEGTIPALFAAQVARSPQATAVVGAGERLTYSELAAWARDLAEWLRGLGIGPESTVGVCLGRSPALVASLLGVLEAGAAYVPLDPAYPTERMAFMLADSGAAVVLADAASQSRVPPGVARVLLVDAAAPAGGGRAAVPCPAGPGNLAYIIYTSGSTGRPKGVAIEHASAAAFLCWAGEVFNAELREGVLAATSICFDLSIFEIFAPLCHGGRVILAADALEFATLPEAAEAGLINTIPSAMAELLRLGVVPRSVRTVNLAGEALPGWLVSRIYEETAVERVLNLYGPSEATTYSLFAQVSRSEAAPPIGRPVAGTRACVIGARGELLPAGVAGELGLGGAGLARGYLGRPDLTAERFVPDPWGEEPGARLYRTGDLVRFRRDGAVELLGRLDQQVKVRGFRIELGEIEAHLARHPAVQAVAAAVYEAAPGDRRIVACLVAATQPAPAADELRRFLAESLPEYMLPAAWIWLAALPLTPNGKIDRKALPRPDGDRPELAVAFVAPRTSLERTLAAAWGEVLGTGEVGVHDNFFALGGHSLLGTRLMARIESRLGVALPLRALFEAPSVAALAGKVEQALGGEGGRRPPLVAGLRPVELPLSFAQERLWLLDQIDGASALYNIPCAVHLTGTLDPASLGRAINEVVRRHEALRTRFEGVSGEPRQVIEPPLPVPLPVVDLAGASEVEVLRQATSEAVRPFDLTRPPLLRACLLRRGIEEHVLVLILHHVAADGWSLGVLVRELAAFYQGESLPELSLQYADFALWQRLWLSGEALAQEVAWWRERLAGVPAEIPLPTDRPRTVAPANRGGRCRATLPLSAELGTLCRAQQATPFMVLLAAFAALLFRWSEEEDLVMGSPVANRHGVETEGLIGFFVNMLPLRVDLAGQPRFTGLLARVREETLAAYVHQDLPFEKLVEALQPPRYLGRTPLFQVSFALQNAPFAAVEIPGLTWSPLPLETGTAKFDLSLSLSEEAGGLAAALTFKADLFDTVTAERLLGHFGRLLAAAVVTPDRRPGELPLLSAAERHAVVIEGNDTVWPVNEERPLHWIFEERAAATPDALALVAGEERLTFGELDRRANAVAQRLLRQGAGLESRVGLAAARTVGTIASLLGILKAGGAYVPLDPTWPAERLRWLLADSGAELLVDGLEPVIPESAAPCVDVTPDNAAYILYTSGSTGLPKGVVVRHGAIVNLARALFGGVYGGDPRPLRVGLNASLAFDGSVKQLIQLVWGHTLYLIPEQERLDPAALVERIRRERLDVLDCTPAQLRLLLAAGLAADPQSGPRLVLVGGEALDGESWELARSRPWTRFVNVYGPTECTVDATACSFSAMATPGTLGRPLANVRVHVVDGEGEPRPVGVPGEIWIGGAGVTRGYLGRPEWTAERFVPDPFAAEPGARLYRSGDRARRLADGSLDFLGRTDHQVKVRGFRIEPGEVEASLRAHPSVSDCAVMARQTTEEESLLVAYVVPVGHCDLSAGALRDFLRDSLPAYMLPSAFVFMPSFPLTPNGKIDRRALPAPKPGGAPGRIYVAPRNALEELLADLWAGVLHVERVGAQDNFFELGGHSLLAFELITRIQAILGVRLPVRAPFETPSLAALAERVADEMARQAGDELLAQAWRDDAAEDCTAVGPRGGGAE
jgi:amino acid adenylation domain-containing protein